MQLLTTDILAACFPFSFTTLATKKNRQKKRKTMQVEGGAKKTGNDTKRGNVLAH